MVIIFKELLITLYALLTHFGKIPKTSLESRFWNLGASYKQQTLFETYQLEGEKKFRFWNTNDPNTQLHTLLEPNKNKVKKSED